MKPISKPKEDSTSTALLFLVLGVCVLVSGCSKFVGRALVFGTKSSEKPTWSAESRSPDGKMVATARTFINSGFGTGGYSSSVDLNWAYGSQHPTTILVFTDAPTEPENASVVKMNWLTPTHLELTYKGKRTIGFQAVKCDGVDISVQDVSDRTISTSEVPSPDRLWLAYARADEQVEPGNSGVFTSVFLKWANGSQPAVEILNVSPDPNSPSSRSRVEMKWADASHLNVTYDGHAKVETKYAKYSNINISVQNICCPK